VVEGPAPERVRRSSIVPASREKFDVSSTVDVENQVAASSP